MSNDIYHHLCNWQNLGIQKWTVYAILVGINICSIMLGHCCKCLICTRIVSDIARIGNFVVDIVALCLTTFTGKIPSVALDVL